MKLAQYAINCLFYFFFFNGCLHWPLLNKLERWLTHLKWCRKALSQSCVPPSAHGELLQLRGIQKQGLQPGLGRRLQGERGLLERAGIYLHTHTHTRREKEPRLFFSLMSRVIPKLFPQGVKGGNPKFIYFLWKYCCSSSSSNAHLYTWQGDFARLCFTL